jgi:UDP-glucose 4-epimerase
MKILITGGAGYIGSITNYILRKNGYETVVFDNLSTGHKEAIGDTPLIIGDLKDFDTIYQIFQKDKYDAVVHFAALSLAGESMEKPFEYFQNNITGGLNLLEAMRRGGSNLIVFSSSCAVYGDPIKLPVTETEPYKPISVYGSSKRTFEQLIEWYSKIYGFRFTMLRYFNACGALPEGELGEDHAPETHIIPIALSVAAGLRKKFEVYGNDYKTPDGTCVRDYIHVLDLADAHMKAIEYIKKTEKSIAVNLGVGKGYSNLEILNAIEKVTGHKIEREFMKRREGDPDAIFADNTFARSSLEWKPKYIDIYRIVETAWIWHKNHPQGYKTI